MCMDGLKQRQFYLTETNRMKLGFNAVALEDGGSSQWLLEASGPCKNTVLLCTLTCRAHLH